MTTDDDFDRQIQAYLEPGPVELADRVLWAARAQLSTTRRRRAGLAWLAPWRNRHMTQNNRLLLAGGGALVVVIGAGLLGSILARPDSGPGTSAAPSAPSSSVASTTPSSSPAPDPSSSVVPTKAPTWSATGTMTEARSLQTATLLPDGKVLVAGGRIGPNADGSATSAELYDPSSGSWIATGNMHGARDGQTATLLPDGRVLVTGGGSRGGLGAVATAELYDPVSGTWTATADMVVPGRGHTATLLLNGQVLVAGSASDLSIAELFEPGSGTWTATAKLVTSRTGHTATLLRDGRVLVTGGWNDFDVNDWASAELYDPGSGSWTATGTLNAGRANHTATLLPDGRVLVAGGFAPGNDSRQLVSAELYDPISGSWTATGDMVTIRGGGYSVTVLPDGKVLVAGGYRSDGNGALASAELYDPGSGTWTATTNMDGLRANQTATLLPDGKVLIAGGLGVIGGSFSPQASAELYDPGGGN